MNGSAAAFDHTDIPNDADWALAGVTDGVNATGLLAEDLDEYGGTHGLFTRDGFLFFVRTFRFRGFRPVNTDRDD